MQTADFLTRFIDIYSGYALLVLPWFFIGLVIAIIVERSVKPETIHTLLGEFSIRKMFIALALGMVSPLSILSAFPLAAGLVRLGAHPALLLAFLAAERSYDLQSFPIISSLFDVRFAALNAFAIFTSLIVAALVIRKMKVTFVAKQTTEGAPRPAWTKHVRMLCIVLIGLLAASLLRTLAPEGLFNGSTGALVDTGTSLFLGLILYLGTIAGNYPVARAFADLGMHSTGVFAFLTISPLLNIVIITIFASSGPKKATAAFFAVYSVVGLLLTAILTPFL